MGRTIICIADALDGHEAAIETLMAWQGRTDIAGRMVEAAIGYLLFALIQRAEWDRVNEIVTRELPQAQELGWTPQLSSLLSAKAMSAALQASPGSKIEADAVYELQRLIHIALTGGALSRALGHAKQTARLFLRSDRKHEAREALESAYGAFTEGFNTPLLRETRALIDELA